MNFEIFGPFKYPKSGNGLVDRSKGVKKEFWKSIEQCATGLSKACGCYVVSGSGPNGSLPHYVGLTHKRDFAAECSAAHVYNQMNEAIAGTRLQPSLFLIARKTPTERFSKPSRNNYPDVKFLEQFLIGLALDRKPTLGNLKGTKYLRGLSVSGFLNTSPGKPTKAATAFRSLMGR